MQIVRTGLKPLAYGRPDNSRTRPVNRRRIRRGMQLWVHVRCCAPLRGAVRRRRVPKRGTHLWAQQRGQEAALFQVFGGADLLLPALVLRGSDIEHSNGIVVFEKNRTHLAI
jgi:hypothetical protein